MLLTGHTATIIIELSPFVQIHDLTNSRTFIDLTLALYSRIPKIVAGYIRADVIIDRYFKNSLKEEIGGARGNEGETIMMRYRQISRNISSETV